LLEGVGTAWGVARWCWRAYRKVSPTARTKFIEWKRNVPIDTLRTYHLDFVHELRHFAGYLVTHRNSVEAVYNDSFHRLCDAASDAMEFQAAIKDQQVHTCLKLSLGLSELPKGSPNVSISENDLLLVTIGRSVSGLAANRDSMLGIGDANPASKNTPFASILGLYDGIQNWKDRAYPTFSCNNLEVHKDKFACARPNFLNYYKSTLVFPIGFRFPHENKHRRIGFLTMDTPIVNGFPGIPSVFDFSSPEEYKAACSKSSLWHLGAAMADSIAACLLPYVELTKEAIESDSTKREIVESGAE